MALIRMSVVKSNEFDQACIACQMAFGCIYDRGPEEILIAAFSVEDGEIIRETIEETGSVYRGTWC